MNTNYILCQATYVQENIPIQPQWMDIKESVHHFFRRPAVIKVLTYLLWGFFESNRQLALLILNCHKIFKEASSYVKDMEVAIHGGDRLSTLNELENRIKAKQAEESETFTPLDIRIEFSTSNSLDAAREMRGELGKEKKIAILNLANRRQPGGVGLAPYAGSQEEYLVRRSNLAWGLDPRFAKGRLLHEKMLEVRNAEGYTDHSFEHHIPYFGAVVSRNVTFIDQPEYDQFEIISSAAPDMRKGSDESVYLERNFGREAPRARREILENKIRAIFDAALAENIQDLVLGAYGCGCFRNDTQEVAEIFADVLQNDMYKGRFNRITFAITDQAKKDIFQRVFADRCPPSWLP